MSKGNEPAFPIVELIGNDMIAKSGLTKRELFSAMALQSLISSRYYQPDVNELSERMHLAAEGAVIFADYLIEELSRVSKENEDCE